MQIRPATAADQERIESILVATGRFTADEVACAVDLVRQGLAHPERNEYLVHVISDAKSDQIAGYVCFGPTPLTDGVYDLYWIAVDPNRQGQGFGSMLLRFVENEIRERSGRMLLIETSSKVSYQPTVRFYESHGYREISRIKDFYRVQDDKIIFSKNIG